MSVFQCAQTIAEALALHAPSHAMHLNAAIQLVSKDEIGSSSASTADIQPIRHQNEQEEDETRSHIRALTTNVIEQPHDLGRQEFWRDLLNRDPHRRQLTLALALRDDIQTRIRGPLPGDSRDQQETEAECASWETVEALVHSETSFETRKFSIEFSLPV